MSGRNAILRALAALLLAVPAHLGRAHHDPGTAIALLTRRIEAGEAGADLYYQRATEFRVLLEHAQAEADLRRALDQDPNHVAARSELARLLGRRGAMEAALEAADQAVASATTPAARAAGQVLVARLLAEDGQKREALVHCERALAAYPQGEVEWYLLQGELLAELGRNAGRPEALRAGHLATGSVVLRNAWIDAALDAGQRDEVSGIIEEELASSRLKSSWLLRRARLRSLTGDAAGAAADLGRCLDELSGRIHPARPDVTLIADRGLALALLGKPEAAAADLARARAAGADRWVTAPLERALARTRK